MKLGLVKSFFASTAVLSVLIPSVSSAQITIQPFVAAGTGTSTMHMKITAAPKNTLLFSWDGTPWRVDQGGTGTTTFANGQLLFFTPGKLSQSQNLFWDVGNNNLGVGTSALSASSAKVTVKGSLGKSLLDIVSSLGVSQFFIDQNGNAGFGNSTPLHRIDVSGAIYSRLVSLANSPSQPIDWNTGNVQSLTLNSNTTLSFLNGRAGGEYNLILKQSTGGKTVTWPASVKWPGGVAPVLTTDISGVDVVKFLYDGISYLGSYDLNYRSFPPPAPLPTPPPPPPAQPPSINGTVTTYAVNTVTTSATFSHTVNAGNNQLLIVAAGAACGGEDTSATFNGVAMTKGASHGSGTQENYNYWYLLAPAQGTHDVVVQFPACAARQYAVITINNVNQTIPFDQDVHAGGTGGNPSVSIITTISNELVLYNLLYNRSLSTFATSDVLLWSVDNEPANDYISIGSARTQVSPATMSVTATGGGGSSWDLIAIPIRPVI